MLSLLAVGGLALPSSSADAEILQISGTGFVRHCPCDAGAADDAEVDRGVLLPQATNTHYFAPVVFPKSGHSVCGFSLIYQDKNANDTLTASLLKKAFTVGGNTFSAPTLMARVRSAAGVVETVRKRTTSTIASPVIDTANAFYFVELLVPTVNLNILGVQSMSGRTATETTIG